MASFTVIYVDRRAREEGMYTRDKRPKKTTGISPKGSALFNSLGSAEEVDDNVNMLLGTFEKGTSALLK